ncbi:efflux RND transporter periplasmic adaptor subunit [Idiomarina piscisalsi]|uniref:efflux RND transporter periplasmic adaptor subunit n=1 Tax=Idiomarina piscisalsi TaxID=1096243 RepID=UPI001384441B|nr:efflux RND transporter periplasmic adaptor subunit [Idiomarina piscisalsi]MTJ01521.1 efflux RND transporter periplasmic adaptor subunit [Idiomarina piscisalsi]
MKTDIFKSALTAFLLAGLLGSPALAQESFTVIKQPINEALSLEGVVEAINQSTVSAQTSGTIVELPVDVDDAVAANQLIVRLDDTEQKARLNRAEANLESAQATLSDAQKRFKRISELYEQNVASEAEKDEAETQLETRKAGVSDAKAAVEEAQKQLSYTEVRAPYAGIVTERFVELGESVQPGQPLMSGLSLEQLRVVTELPLQYASYVRDNRKADVVTDDGRELSIASMTFYPYASEQSHTFRLRLNLHDPEGALFPGMLVKVKVAVGERNALLIPKTALLVEGELRGVYVLGGNDTPQLRQVRVGERKNGQVEILAGLAEGEQVLASVEAMLDE